MRPMISLVSWIKTGLRIALGLLITFLSLKTVWHLERANVVEGRTQAQLEQLAADPYDPLTGLHVRAVALHRQVEMLQWNEYCQQRESERKQCKYQPLWLDVLERSGSFDRQFSDQGLANPAVFPEESLTLWGEGNRQGAWPMLLIGFGLLLPPLLRRTPWAPPIATCSYAFASPPCWLRRWRQRLSSGSRPCSRSALSSPGASAG